MNILTYRLTLLVLSVFLSTSVSLFSQNSEAVNCGNTTSTKTLDFYKNIKPQLKKYEDDFLASKSAKGTVPYQVLNAIPVKAYIVRNSDGSGGLDMNDLNHAISNLNEIYKDAYLEFFLCDGVQYIDDDNLCHFKKGNEKDIIESNYVPGLLNLYFTDYIENESSEAICGYSDNVGRNDFVVMRNSCATNASSLPHEIGHFFSLLHTHGADNNGTTELVDGSNCDTDGDGICDTPADPTLSYSSVDDSCNYTGSAIDANGDAYHPDTRNMMSYSRKECRQYFSEQQLARMYAFYMTTKSYLSCPSFNANIAVNESETCDDYLTVNFESLNDNVTDWQWDIDGDGVIDYNTQNPSHTFETGIYDVILTVSNKSRTISKKFVNFIKVGTFTDLLDEDFEEFNLLDQHGWTSRDVTGHGYNWYTNYGNTQSNETGPINYYKKSESELNTYIYAEASGASAGDITELISPCIDVKYQNSELEFSYHMYGKDVGELHVDIKTDTGYNLDVIPPFIGSQQNTPEEDFKTKTIDLSAYANQTIKVRFRAVRGSGWKGDIAIDNILVKTIHTAISDNIYNVYPNPIREGLLYIKNNDLDTVSTYIVTNLVGQPFLSGTITESPIDLSKLSSGTYLLTLTNGKNRVVKKIIK